MTNKQNDWLATLLYQPNLSIEDLNLENKNFLTYSEFIYSLSLTALLFDYDDKTVSWN